MLSIGFHPCKKSSNNSKEIIFGRLCHDLKVYMNVMGTKWVFRNKTDKLENATRNKARMVT